MGIKLDNSDLKWMNKALELASRAEKEGEVPVGAVVVCNDQLVGEGWNQPIGGSDPSAHAEIMALRQAGQSLNNYRLPGCLLYVTLEPCVMCLGAMLHARLDGVVFGASDPKTGALGGAFQMPENWAHNHHLSVKGGVLANESSHLLRAFFKARRQRSKQDSDIKL